jgi:hypothetical protein
MRGTHVREMFGHFCGLGIYTCFSVFGRDKGAVIFYFNPSQSQSGVSSVGIP